MYRLKKLLVFIKCINLFYKDNEEEKINVSAKQNQTKNNNNNNKNQEPPKQNINRKKQEQRVLTVSFIGKFSANGCVI